jgi:hypothetical protein
MTRPDAGCHAAALLMSFARDDGDPVTAADRRTSMADARAALCLAHGVDPADITPLGYDHTPAAYERVRESWVAHIAGFGWRDLTDAPHLAAARGYWAGFTAGDNWLNAGWERHLTRPDRCPRPCDICQPATLLGPGYFPATA